MRCHHMRAIGVCGVFVLAALVATGCAGKATDYSAEQVHLDASGKDQGSMKYFVSGDKIRTEMEAPQGEGTLVTIYRKDTAKLIMLNPESKVYFEKDLTEDDLKKTAAGLAPDSKTKQLGHEEVNGYKCEKMEVETTVSFMGMTRKSVSTVWKSDEFDIPLRTKSQEGDISELRNIKTGRQPSSLFEVPKGYEKADSMFALFGVGGGPGGATGGAKQDTPRDMQKDVEGFFNNLNKQLRKEK